MSSAFAARLLAIMIFTAALFWETLSHLGTKGVFDGELYVANSEQFLMVAPVLLFLWLMRHFLPGHIDKTLKIKGYRSQDDVTNQTHPH